MTPHCILASAAPLLFCVVGAVYIPLAVVLPVEVELVTALLPVLVELLLPAELTEELPEPEERLSLKTPPPTVLGVTVLAFCAAMR